MQYDIELDRLGDTYQLARNADLGKLSIAVSGASASSIIGVGSGGSFTVASLLCNLHETSTGRVSRASTPLEIICSPTLAAASPVFVISAEGRNPDAVEVLRRARRHSARTVHLLTNRADSPLIDCARTTSDVTTHVFELADKDGYLATNSLLLDAMIVARTYQALASESQPMPESIDGLRLAEGTIDEWLSEAGKFVTEVAARGNVIVIFAPLLRSIATDLESKLSEAALVHCQLADLRSFAHGRHLWLAQRPSDCTVLAIVDPSLMGLWRATRELLPPSVPSLTMAVGGTQPQDLLGGLVAQMRFVSRIAHAIRRDPARPNVPQFGRDIHYFDLEKLIPPPEDSSDGGEHAKHEVLGARWPRTARTGRLHRAREAFADALRSQVFRAIVFDYDGTLCTSQSHDSPPPKEIVDHLSALLDAGVRVGIATGRGRSIQDNLRQCLPESRWGDVRVGLYNCGWMSDLASSPTESGETSEFLSHVIRIVSGLKRLGMPIEKIRATHPHQVSVRLCDGVDGEKSWFTIADALRQAGLDPSRVVYSKHSVDVLNTGVDKSHLIADFVQGFRIHPHEILAIGDQGAWPGNDAALLEHRFSLSVDVPSRRMDRGWKLAPKHRRDVDATLWYLDCVTFGAGGTFTLSVSAS